MKKIICILMSVLMLSSLLCTVASAEDNGNIYVFETEDACCVVEFYDDNLTEEQQAVVARRLVYPDEETVSTYGLGCTLFGHDLKTTTASVITHKVRASNPRCKKDTYRVTYCEDCDYSEQTLIETKYIVCCE